MLQLTCMKIGYQKGKSSNTKTHKALNPDNTVWPKAYPALSSVYYNLLNEYHILLKNTSNKQ